MKRDMELCRKILLAIEEQYTNEIIIDLNIEGYTAEQVAYHCSILCDAGLLSHYEGQNDNGKINYFIVGPLTWEGHEFLDKIRSDSVWNKTKDIFTKNGIPMAVDAVKEIAQTVIASMIEGAIKGMK